MPRARVALAVALVALAGCGGGEKASEPLPSAVASMKLTSPAFTDGGTLPTRFTCSGKGVSPPLAWSGVPPRARELALVVEDPDAGRFVHWTMLKISTSTHAVGEGGVPPGAIQTANTFGDKRWGAACPPKGAAPHRYVFALYALRAPLGLGADASPDAVRSAIAKQAIARGELTARFGRP